MSGRVAIVANERPWPVVSGGRLRIAGIATSLCEVFDVRIVAPSGGGAALVPVGEPDATIHPTHESTTPKRSHLGRATALVRSSPEIALSLYPPRVVKESCALLRQFDAHTVLFTHNYLATRFPKAIREHSIIDHPNLEALRYRSLAGDRTGPRRWKALLDSVKANLWEPKTARSAAICVVTTREDAEVVRGWGARSIAVVPNTVERQPVPRDKSQTAAVFYGDLSYQPNADAVRRLFQSIWPIVSTRLPSARLKIAGRVGDGTLSDISDHTSIEYLGFVDDLGEVLASAAVVAVPVTSGGGTQLKTVEAIRAGVPVVASPFAARAMHALGLDDLLDIAVTDEQFAAALLRYLASPDHRRRRETEIRRAAVRIPTWREAVEPLVPLITSLCRSSQL